MMVLLWCFVALHLPVLAAGFLDELLHSKVCYDVIGCFDNSAPFTNSWHLLPDSPDKVGITLRLHTRSGPPGGEAVEWRDAKKMVTSSHFRPGAGTKVIVHGYLNNGSEPWVVDMKNELLKVDDFNVIIAAWGPGAHTMYPRAVANTRVVGAVIAHLLTSLKLEHNVSMSSVHLLGHSLGAHISGYAGSRVGGVGRISGMDPAGPLFESTDETVRIDPSDADFVDCIHSDGAPFKDMGFGTMAAWCDADFYPNGGVTQPGCSSPVSHALGDVFSLDTLDAENAVSCSHSRSHDLYVQSIRRCQFLSTPCQSYAGFKAHHCTCVSSPSNQPCVAMGYHSANFWSLRPRGKYYLFTTDSAPYC